MPHGVWNLPAIPADTQGPGVAEGMQVLCRGREVVA